MKFLGFLLYGSRRIRTPLAAGSCWIVLLWLAIRPHLPQRGHETGLTETIYEFGRAVHTPGVLLIVAGTAYLFGALTVQLLMVPLAVFAVPADARMVFVRRTEIVGGAPSASNFRTEAVAPYVVRGLLPVELHGSEQLRNDFSRLCAEAEFRFVTPVPVVALGVYLAAIGSVWWALLAAVLILVLEGRRRFVMACHLLSGAAASEIARLQSEVVHSYAASNPTVGRSGARTRWWEDS